MTILKKNPISGTSIKFVKCWKSFWKTRWMYWLFGGSLACVSECSRCSNLLTKSIRFWSQSNRWVELASLITGRSYHCAGIIESVVFTACGYEDDALKTYELLDMRAGGWVQYQLPFKSSYAFALWLLGVFVYWLSMWLMTFTGLSFVLERCTVHGNGCIFRFCISMMKCCLNPAHCQMSSVYTVWLQFGWILINCAQEINKQSATKLVRGEDFILHNKFLNVLRDSGSSSKHQTSNSVCRNCRSIPTTVVGSDFHSKLCHLAIEGSVECEDYVFSCGT